MKKIVLIICLSLATLLVAEDQEPKVSVFYMSPQACELIRSFLTTGCQPNVMILTKGFSSEYLGITLIYAEHGTSNVRYASQFVLASPGHAVFQVDRHISIWSVRVTPLSKSGPEVVVNPAN